MTEQQACYTEKVVYLPDSYQVNDSGRRIAERTPTRKEVGLPDRGFVFCSFNNNYKITPPVFDVWMSLLRQVDGSVLWLLDGTCDGCGAICGGKRLPARSIRSAWCLRLGSRRKTTWRGIALPTCSSIRFRTTPTRPQATRLWAGLPVLTCAGNDFRRPGGGEPVAGDRPAGIDHSTTLDEYEALALRLARDKTMLAAIRAKLARNRQTFPLFDTDRFRRHIESAYVEMCGSGTSGRKPRKLRRRPGDYDQESPPAGGLSNNFTSMASTAALCRGSPRKTSRKVSPLEAPFPDGVVLARLSRRPNRRGHAAHSRGVVFEASGGYS